MMEKEKQDIRAFDLQIRAAEQDKPPMLYGYAARFNEWSDDLGGFRERIRPGAFKKALMTSDVRALYNHDTSHLPLGRTPKTLRLAEDTKGLKVEIDLPDTQQARDLMTSIQRGDINQMSFGFSVANDGDEWVEKEGMISRTINEIRELYDVSPVVYPAYSSTKIAVRTKEKLDETKSAATRGDGSTEATLQDERRNMDIDLLTIQYNHGGSKR